MKPKAYLNILKFGLALAPLTFLLVFSSLLFPYITSKQITFNILMEVLLVFGLILWIKYPAYRPKKSYITYGLLAYFATILISCFVGVDFNLSFWGNAERMLGFFHLFHYLIFYLLLITAYRRRTDWYYLFDAAILVSVAIAVFGLFKADPQNPELTYPASTIGNSAYVAGLMIFAFFLSLWQLINTPHKAGKVIWQIGYGLAGLLILIGFVRADISGAQAGLVLGLIIFGLLLVFLNKNKKLKIAVGSLTAVAIIILVSLFSLRWQPYFDNTWLGQNLRDFSTENVTLNTRLLSWQSAYLDFKYHPVFGVGYGNYSAVFDRHFNPKFYDYSRNETYFDRAHNNLIDIASTTGVVGLLTYLAIFVATIYYLVTALKKHKITGSQFALLIGVLSAYFIQNLAVFDTLVTYVLLFIVLGFIYYLSQEKTEVVGLADADNQLADTAKISGRKETLIFTVIALIMLTSIYEFSVRGFVMLNGVINGYITIVRDRQINDGISKYQAVLDLPVGYNRDSRSSLVNIVIGSPQILTYAPSSQINDDLNYIISLAQRNAAYNPDDSLLQMQLAQIASVGVRYNANNLGLANQYSQIAVNAIDQAIASSPGRVPLYFVRAGIYLTRGDETESLKSLETAVALKPDYPGADCYLANFAYYFKQTAIAYQALVGCDQYGSLSLIPDQELLTDGAGYYAKNGQPAFAAKLKAQIELNKQANSSSATQ